MEEVEVLIHVINVQETVVNLFYFSFPKIKF